jgi:hypothetical protein
LGQTYGFSNGWGSHMIECGIIAAQSTVEV